MLPSELEAQRKVLHLSQAEMAERLGVSRHTYMRWESGVTKKLPGDLAARAGAALGGKAAEILDRGEELVDVSAATHRSWYEKVSSRGVYVPNDSHPMGHSGVIKRKYLDAYARRDWVMWQKYVDSKKIPEPVQAPTPRTAAPQYQFPTVDECLGRYETTGQDDDETERRMQNYFQSHA